MKGANPHFSPNEKEMRPAGFDPTDERRSRSGVAPNKVRKRRAEASAATVAAEAKDSQTAIGL